MDLHPQPFTAHQVVRLRISLNDVHPAVWRRVEVSSATTLAELHAVFQAVMLFEDYHLYQFEVGDDEYTVDADESDDGASEPRLRTIGQLVERGIIGFTYVYDFGDNWQHTVMIEGNGAAAPDLIYPRLVDGAHAAPPEDVGGVSGFENFVEAMTTPRHKDKRRWLEWHGRKFDPATMDRARIDKRLDHLRR